MNAKELMAERYAKACAKAQGESLDGCSVHVNAVCGFDGTFPAILGFTVSDWYSDGQTVATYRDGIKGN